LQLSHRNERDKTKVDKQVLDLLNASVQRANLILSEFVVGSDAKHIVNFSVKASTFTFKREQELDGALHSHLNLCVGDVEGDMPIHAQNLHEVVLRNAPQLNEQMTRLEYSEPTLVGEYSPHLQYRQAVAVVHFEIRVSSIELTAQLLPSLKTMYRLEEAESSGKTLVPLVGQHIFTTDLLNQVLFAEQASNSNAFRLFQQLFVYETALLFLIIGTYSERLYGKATIGVSAKLGQLVKTAMFEEIETELQEFATFMTQ
uniref:Uncharacterized protein n=1 Tax=Parascaris equorum TaxID=6256 RepID=A0A914RPV7_PAREQ